MPSKLKDERLFIRVHIGFPEHWKTIELSDKAFRHLVEAWCFCARNLTDGRLTSAQIKKLFTPKTVRELVKVSYLYLDDSGGQMHDYLDHQMSAQSVTDLRSKRSQAGRKGGLAKAANLASASGLPEQKGSTAVPDLELDLELELVTTEVVTSVGRPTASRGTRLPPDWAPNRALIEWVKSQCPAVNGRAETDKFRDYWISKSGKDATKADWDATYRNWMRRANEQAPGRPTGAVSTASTGDQRLAAGLELHAKYAAAEAASEAPELERTP